MHGLLLTLILVVVMALIFDYINGFHDTANAIATVVSTGVLPIRTAVLVAATLNFGGAFLGTAVASTVGKDLLHPGVVTQVVVLRVWPAFAVQPLLLSQGAPPPPGAGSKFRHLHPRFRGPSPETG